MSSIYQLCCQKKCVIAQRKIEYLGNIVLVEGVVADPAKIDAMLTWPVPTNLRELCGFLGLMGYDIKFVKGYSNNRTIEER